PPSSRTGTGPSRAAPISTWWPMPCASPKRCGAATIRASTSPAGCSPTSSTPPCPPSCSATACATSLPRRRSDAAEARTASTSRRRTGHDLLDRPRVAVGVLEVDERSPRLVVDGTHRHAPFGEMGMGRVDVGHYDLERHDRALVVTDEAASE